MGGGGILPRRACASIPLGSYSYKKVTLMMIIVIVE